MDSSSPAPSVHGILQAIILEWVSISSPGDLPNPGIEPSSPTLQADALTSAAAAAKLLPTSLGFSRQEYWSGLPFP